MSIPPTMGGLDVTYQDRDRVTKWLTEGNGEKLTLLDRVILITIAESVDGREKLPNGKPNGDFRLSYPGLDYLALLWGTDIRSVKRSIARLHDAGLLNTARRGVNRRRARYRLVGGHVGHPDMSLQGDSSVTLNPDFRVTEESVQGDRGVISGGHVGHPLSESSRSLRSDDDSGRVENAPSASPPPEAPASSGSSVVESRNGPAIGAGMVTEIADQLDMSESDARDWAESKLKGRHVAEVPAYLRECIKNYRPPKKRSPPKTKPERKQQTRKSAKTSTTRSCPYCSTQWDKRSGFKSHLMFEHGLSEEEARKLL